MGAGAEIEFVRLCVNMQDRVQDRVWSNGLTFFLFTISELPFTVLSVYDYVSSSDFNKRISEYPPYAPLR